MAKSLIMETSDHWPCIIEISTAIPAAKVFRFENFWLQFESFKPTVQQAWLTYINAFDPAKRLTAKFKHLRGILRTWNANLSSLFKLIKQVKSVIYLLETIEVLRDLSIQEWNFRNTLYDKLISLLKMQKTYWKQRAKIKWVQEGDAGTKLFHAHASVKHRRNSIASLLDDSNVSVTQHDQKANLIWNSFRQMLGISEFGGMLFDLEELFSTAPDLSALEADFSREEIDNIISELPN